VLHALPISSSLTWSSNYIWRGVQVMELLIMQCSPISCHFISLRTKYSLLHPVLKRPQSMFLNCIYYNIYIYIRNIEWNRKKFKIVKRGNRYEKNNLMENNLLIYLLLPAPIILGAGIAQTLERRTGRSG
jgi:hypothetical protein